MRHLSTVAESPDTQPAANHVRVAAGRALGMIAFLAIFATALAAFAGAPVWAVVPGTLVLLTISLLEQRKLSARFAAIGASYVLTMAAWESAGNALMATGGAYALGAVTRALMLA
jgi:hypothetical protein